MRALERFLIAFAAIALGMRVFHAATAPVFLLLGLPALGLYYLAAFPFLDYADASATRVRWLQLIVRFLTGAALAYGLLGLTVYLLGWIQREQMLVSCCVVLGLLLFGHGTAYRKNKAAFSLQSVFRAGSLLAIIVAVGLLVSSVYHLR